MRRQIDIKHLADVFAKAEAEFGHDETALLHVRAHSVLLALLGRQWVENRLQASPFHVTEFAHYLFSLRECYGFSALLDRFDKQDAGACLVEAQIGSTLLTDGFEVQIKPPSGKRGQDFDFSARKCGTIVSVEVTETRKTATVNSILNLLKRKRTQVPDDFPAVLCVRAPRLWASDPSAMESIQKAEVDPIRWTGNGVS